MNSIEKDPAIAAAIRERDAALLAGIEALIALARKRGKPFPNRDMAEVTLHKARTAATSLPLELRRASKQWLSARGYHSLDDGEV
jgi:hypothetical protein